MIGWWSMSRHVGSCTDEKSRACWHKGGWLPARLPPTSRSGHDEFDGGVSSQRGSSENFAGKGLLAMKVFTLTTNFGRLNDELDETEMRYDHWMSCQNRLHC